MDSEKRFGFVVLFCVVLAGLCLPAGAQFGGGTGDPNDPYLIYTAEQMNAIGADPNCWDKHFKLMADIDLSVYPGDSFNIIAYRSGASFSGVFDGNGHTISNFTHISSGGSYVGLFGNFGGSEAEIKNLGLLTPEIWAPTGWIAGALVGSAGKGTISHCYVDGGTVLGGDRVGGLIGYADWSTLTQCYSTAAVSGDGVGVGGLIGGARGIELTHSYSTGSVDGKSAVGGLLGLGYSVSLAYCYSAGPVTGDMNVGGLVGSGSYIGTFACFWDMEASGQTDSDGGVGRTTAEMWSASTFLSWGACDAQGLWTLHEGEDYPRLSWEDEPGEVLPAVDLSDFLVGTGTPDDPFRVYTAEELDAIGLFPWWWNSHFLLMADIDLSDYAGSELNVIGVTAMYPFTGVFDGNGHAIKNFTCCSAGTRYLGLFGLVDDPDAQIKNLGMIDVQIDGGDTSYSGGLVGRLYHGTVSSCCVKGGTVSGDLRAGGLIGDNNGKIENCYATCDVSCDNVVTVPAQPGQKLKTGPSVKRIIIPKHYAGGLVGENDGMIRNCYSTGVVVADSNTCGLVGASGGDVISSFWDMDTSGQAASRGGEGKTTAEMMDYDTYFDAGWDFVEETYNGTQDIWWIEDSVDYPRLWWEAGQ